MSRFATKPTTNRTQPTTSNHAGGDAFEQSARLALTSLVLTSVLIDKAYRSGGEELGTVADLLQQLDAKSDLEFAAKLALYARHEHGLRTITHVLAGEIALFEGSYPWRRAFLDKIVRRPDDAVEIVAYVRTKRGEGMLPNALKRGLGAALVRFDEYALSKYNQKGKSFGLIDLVNLCHPKAPKKHPIHLLMTGKIANAMTWEMLLSEAGAAKDPTKAKAAAWKKILAEDQLGYMACLMNLRNIVEQAPASLSAALAIITDEKLIKKSLLMPTQFISAAKAVAEINGPGVRETLAAINTAVETALDNVPKLSGRTLIALDASGSMNGRASERYTCFEIGALFAAVLYKANRDTDFMYFANDGKYMSFDAEQKLLPLREQLVQKRIDGGTNFHAIFQTANRAYDRIVILSDMQAWMATGEWQRSTPQESLAEYRKRTASNPAIYSFDLQGLGTAQFPENRVFALAGFTDKVFTVMGTLEKDRKALVHEIEEYHAK